MHRRRAPIRVLCLAQQRFLMIIAAKEKPQRQKTKQKPKQRGPHLQCVHVPVHETDMAICMVLASQCNTHMCIAIGSGRNKNRIRPGRGGRAGERTGVRRARALLAPLYRRTEHITLELELMTHI